MKIIVIVYFLPPTFKLRRDIYRLNLKYIYKGRLNANDHIKVRFNPTVYSTQDLTRGVWILSLGNVHIRINVYRSFICFYTHKNGIRRISVPGIGGNFNQCMR